MALITFIAGGCLGFLLAALCAASARANGKE